MSEKELELEKLKGLMKKLYHVRESRLETVDVIVEKNNKLIGRLRELDEKLAEAQKILEGCKPKEIKRWMAIVKTIETRKQLLGAEKMSLKENRLALTFLVKEEKRLEYLIRKLKAGVED